MVTNGQLVGEVGVENLLESGLSEIGISIDGPDEVINDEIRGRGTFSKAWEALEQISDYLFAQRMDINVLLSVTAMSKNIKHIPALIRRVSNSEFNIDKITVDKVVPEGRALETSGLEVSPKMWLDMCEQVCTEWRNYKTLFHLILRVPPLVHNYLISKYQIFLRDSIIGCPALESSHSGCLTSEGTIYSCGREFLIRRAQNSKYFPLQGKNYRELISLTGSIFNLQDFSSSLRPIFGPPSAPVCRECMWKSECVQCPILNLLGEKYSPNLCQETLKRINGGFGGLNDSDYRKVGNVPIIFEHSMFTFSNDVYLKHRKEGSIIYLSPTLDRMVTFPEGIHAEFLFDYTDQPKSLSELRRAFENQYSISAWYLDLVLFKLIDEQFINVVY